MVEVQVQTFKRSSFQGQFQSFQKKKKKFYLTSLHVKDSSHLSRDDYNSFYPSIVNLICDDTLFSVATMQLVQCATYIRSQSHLSLLHLALPISSPPNDPNSCVRTTRGRHPASDSEQNGCQQSYLIRDSLIIIMHCIFFSFGTRCERPL